MANGRQRLIRDTFWIDSYIESKTPDEKLVFLYLLTNPSNNIAGIYKIQKKRIAFDTGYDIEVIETLLRRFEEEGKILMHDNWIIMVNHIKNQALNPSVIKGCRRILRELPLEMQEKITGWVQAGLLNLTLLNLTLLNLTSFFQDEEEQEVSVPVSKYQFEDIDTKFAEMFDTKIKHNFSSQKKKKTNLKSWADTFRKLRELDGRSQEEIYYTICWVQGGKVNNSLILPEHSFWSANIQSPDKLRKQWFTLWAQIEQGQKLKVPDIDLTAVGL